jgi:MFS family permease
MVLNTEEKKILGLTTCSHGLVHMFEGVLPPLIPLMLTEFHTNYFELGMIATVFSYAFGLGSLPGGVVGDWLGPRKLISFYLVSSGVVGTLVLFSDTLLAYGILMGFLGLSASVYHAASNALISLKIRELGKAFGIHGIAGSLGVSLAPIVSASLGSKWGWKAPHVALGIFALALACFSLTIQDVEKRKREKGPKDTARQKALLLFYFFSTAAFLGITYKAVMTFLPSYMGERVEHFFGLSLNKVTLGGTVATLALLSGSLGQYVAGRLVGRYEGEKLYLFVIVVGTVFSLLMYFGSGIGLILYSVGFSLFYFATQPIQNYLLSTYISQSKRTAGYGLHFSITFGVGSIAAALGGLSADKFGLGSVFLGSALCFFISGLFCILLIRNKSKVMI